MDPFDKADPRDPDSSPVSGYDQNQEALDDRPLPDDGTPTFLSSISVSPAEAAAQAASPRGPRSVAQLSWSWLDGVIVVVAAFLMYFIGSVVLVTIDLDVQGGGALGLHGHRRPFDFWVTPASYLCLTASAFLMVGIWLVARRGASWRDVGFRLPRGYGYAVLLRIIGIAFLAYLVTVFGSAAIVHLVDMTPFHIKSNVKELLPQGQTTVSQAQFVVLLILTGVLAPITEETLFRGALFQGFARSFSRGTGTMAGVTLAAFLAGTVFGLFHLVGGGAELYALPILVFLGIVLSFTFQFSETLYGSMLLHSAINLISTIAYFGAHVR